MLRRKKLSNVSTEYRFIAGLGNPGRRYERTRHNVGFVTADLLFEREGQAPVWKERSGALVSELSLAGRKVIVAKPQTYMNLSGGPIQSIMSFFKIEPSQLVVVHDEVDLPFGTLRLKQGGGDAGHNGLKSISEAIGSDYTRLRLGVGRAPTEDADGKPLPPLDTADWVLQPFKSSDEEVLHQLLDCGVGALKVLFEKGLQSAQNQFHS